MSPASIMVGQQIMGFGKRPTTPLERGRLSAVSMRGTSEVFTRTCRPCSASVGLFRLRAPITARRGSLRARPGWPRAGRSACGEVTCGQIALSAGRLAHGRQSSTGKSSTLETPTRCCFFRVPRGRPRQGRGFTFRPTGASRGQCQCGCRCSTAQGLQCGRTIRPMTTAPRWFA